MEVDMDNNFKYSISIKNFGPFESHKCEIETNKKNKVALYARNGGGKTFFSRALNALNDNSTEAHDYRDFISMDKDEATIEFNFEGKGNASCKTSLKINRNSHNEPQDHDYKFYVFNSDYVAQNVWGDDFTPDGNINGYITGKENIDIAKEEERLCEIENKDAQIRNAIISSLLSVKEDLKGLGVNLSAQYADCLREDLILNGTYPDIALDYVDALKQSENLNSLPDSIEDIAAPSFPEKVAIDDSLIKALEIELKEFNPVKLLLDDLKQYSQFYEYGLSLYRLGGTKCPLCGERLTSEGASQLKEIEEYFDNATSSAIKEFQELQTNINQFRINLTQFRDRFEVVRSTYSNISEKLPSIELKALDRLESFEDLLNILNQIINILNKKINNPEEVIDVKIFTELDLWYDRLADEVKDVFEKIKLINQQKEKLNSEKTRARKSLCESAAKKIVKQNSSYIEELKQLLNEYSELQKDINSKKSKFKKKEYVAERFSALLSIFFGNKYQFEKEEFRLKFYDRSLLNNSASFLSEGEKTIVAFCYYLAEAITIFDEVPNWNNVFFIIDDPVSSLDYDKAYQVAQCLRNLHDYVKDDNKNMTTNLIILTHNYSFYNILIANNIVSYAGLLTHDCIQVNKKVLLPYEEHLRDLRRVSQGLERPDHTTGNSLRHVIETLWHFNCPKITSLTDFINSIEDFKSNNLINLLCNDLSHGHLSDAQPFEDEELVNACNCLFNYIESYHKGQIEYIDSTIN